MRLLPPLFPSQSAISILNTSTNNYLNASVHTPFTEKSASAPREKHKPSLLRYPTLSAVPLSRVQTEALADELNTVYQSVMDSLGAKDARYIQQVYATVVYSEMTARLLLAVAGRMPSKKGKTSLWLLGTSLLSFSKILNNMELGHNVMHGQYDWMQHPHLNSQTFDWDIVCPAPLWQHSHNYLHHTFTNIVERDHDVGYHLIRVTDEQSWTPSDRYNPLKTMILALGFEWAVAFHDIQISVDEYVDSTENHAILQQKSRALWIKIMRQVGKDYIALPAGVGLALGRSSAVSTLSGNVTANIVRNLWTWAVIFCGHLTEQAHIYTHLDENESKGDWYVRQILGSSNIQGSKLFHILTGNLSHQIEHHIFPDMPAHRYASISPQVQAICSKYDLAYNTGRFGRQFRQVLGRIYYFSKPHANEQYAYTQEKSKANGNSIKTSQRHRLPVRGLKKYIPQVVRQALFYAK